MSKMLTTIMSVATGESGGNGDGNKVSESRAAAAAAAVADVSIVDILGESQRRRLSLVATSASSAASSISAAAATTAAADSGIGGGIGGGGGLRGETSGAALKSDDVYSQLAQKENDLILAAELGKALLEKNEELRRQNDAMAEGFQNKIEVGMEPSTGGSMRKDLLHS